MDYSQLLIKSVTKYANIIDNSNLSHFECADFFKLPNIEDVIFDAPHERIKEICAVDNERASKIYWLADSSTFHDIFTVNTNGEIKNLQLTTLAVNTALKCTINGQKLFDLKNTNKQEYDKIITNLNKDNNEHFLTFGECPQEEADSITSAYLENLFNNGKFLSPLTNTGKYFTINGNTSLLKDKYANKFLPEFELNGTKYVRIVYFNKKDKIEIKWQKVTPIKWKILNWEDFCDNFAENRKKKDIECISEKAIIYNLPFHTLLNECNNLLWQNSLIRAFANSENLQDMDKNNSFLSTTNYNFSNSGFLYQCINLENKYCKEYIIPKNEEELCSFAFCGCVNFDKISIPSHVKQIEQGAFDCLSNTVKVVFYDNKDLKVEDKCFENANFKFIYITKDAKNVITVKTEDEQLNKNCFKFDYSFENFKLLMNGNFRKNYILMKSLKDNKYIKFIPPQYTLEVFPNSCIQNYYVNRNYLRWKKLTKELELVDLDWKLKDKALSSLLKIYYAIGGFSENQGESEKAYKFLVNAVYYGIDEIDNNTKYHITIDLINQYSQLNLDGEYNKEFAKFFMKNYKANFMCYTTRDKYGNIQPQQNLLPLVHNNFANILSSLPNKRTTGHDIRTLLTPEFLATHCIPYIYDEENKDNKKLAETIRPYGYSQKDFEEMQNILTIAKQIKNISTIKCGVDTTNCKIKFRQLSKDDEEGFILGDKTNSCFKLNKLGAPCLKDAYINPDASIIVFEYNDEKNNKTTLIAHSYVWYNKIEKTICFDNIDIPFTQKLYLEKNHLNEENNLTCDDLITAIDNCAKSIHETMNKTENKVTHITVGLGQCNIHSELQQKYKLLQENLICSHNVYRGYTDANKKQVEIIKD